MEMVTHYQKSNTKFPHTTCSFPKVVLYSVTTLHVVLTLGAKHLGTITKGNFISPHHSLLPSEEPTRSTRTRYHIS